jgi:Family of unknown function (DUF5990)
MNNVEVYFRLLRRDDVPATNPFNLSYQFGLQDTRQKIIAGERQSNGVLVFDFSLKAKNGKNPKFPVFTGRFASGPVDDRFVYLSWFAIDRGDYINRVKARLATVDWEIVRNSLEKRKRITADMTGWSPGDKRKYVTWYLV